VAKAPFGAGAVGYAYFLGVLEFDPKPRPKRLKKVRCRTKIVPEAGMKNTFPGILSTPCRVIPVDCG
jgi:hypothetical protein